LHWKVVPISEVPKEEKKPGIHMGKETQKMHWYGKVEMDHFKALVDSATKTWMGFIPGHPQADVEGNIYMMLPKGFELNDGRNIRTMLRNY